VFARHRRRAWRFLLLAAAEPLDDRVTDGIDPQASCRQHVGRDAALLAQEPEQQVFGSDVLLQQPIGFFGGVLQRTLAGRAERDLVGLRNFRAGSEATEDVAANIVEGDAASLEDSAAKPFAFVQQPEEDVLGLDGARPELADLGASVEKDLVRS
jgi:hypothetical protein